MTVNVKAVTETNYTVDIPDIPAADEDKFFRELSQKSYMDDIMDIEDVLEEKNVYYETTEGETYSRIEMQR